MRTLRIFISSPGDVTEERQNAGKVLERLQGKYWSFVRLDDVFASGSNDKTIKLWDMATGEELATLKGHFDWVWHVAFSPDGGRLASRSRDNTIKFWDTTTGKEIAENLTFSYNSNLYSPDGKILAIREDVRIHLAPQIDHLPLLDLERKGYLTFSGREIVWMTNDSLLNTRQFEPIHWRNDLLAQLAGEQDPSNRFFLRLQLCGKGGQWRAFPTIWEEIRKSGFEAEAKVRQEFCVQAAIALRSLAVGSERAAPSGLWKLLLSTCEPGQWEEPRFTLPMAQAYAALLAARGEHPEMAGLAEERFAAIAPEWWRKAVQQSKPDEGSGDAPANEENN